MRELWSRVDEFLGDGALSGLCMGAFLCWTAFAVAAEVYYVSTWLLSAWR